MIKPSTLYGRDSLQADTGLTDAAWKTLVDRGLPVLVIDGREYAEGKHLILGVRALNGRARLPVKDRN